MSHVAQGGAIAIRRGRSGIEVLVARAKKNPREWIFPKGHIEPGESAAETAVRELQEETGIAGEVIRPIGTSTFKSGRDEVEVTYFLVRFLGTAPSVESREIRWTDFAEAKILVTFPDASRLLDAAERAVGDA